MVASPVGFEPTFSRLEDGCLSARLRARLAAPRPRSRSRGRRARGPGRGDVERTGGIEPPSPDWQPGALPLSYVRWSGWQDSNLRFPGPKPGVMASSLHPAWWTGVASNHRPRVLRTRALPAELPVPWWQGRDSNPRSPGCGPGEIAATPPCGVAGRSVAPPVVAGVGVEPTWRAYETREKPLLDPAIGPSAIGRAGGTPGDRPTAQGLAIPTRRGRRLVPPIVGSALAPASPTTQSLTPHPRPRALIVAHKSGVQRRHGLSPAVWA